MITKALIDEWFFVHRDIVRWKKRPSKSINIGDIAGGPDKRGIVRITVPGVGKVNKADILEVFNAEPTD